ncbi:MAG: hypothetical protein AAGB25_10425, partial [Pseudomonadota bacterium]
GSSGGVEAQAEIRAALAITAMPSLESMSLQLPFVTCSLEARIAARPTLHNGHTRPSFDTQSIDQ